MASSVRPNIRPLPRHERYIYTYRLLANATPLHFMISCVKHILPLHDPPHIEPPSAALIPSLGNLGPANTLSVSPSKQMASNDRYANLLHGHSKSIHDS